MAPAHGICATIARPSIMRSAKSTGPIRRERFTIRRRLGSIDKAAIAVAAIGLLANAAVCGILSGVTDRYQGRVAWVLPALGFIILARVWGTKTRPALA